MSAIELSDVSVAVDGTVLLQPASMRIADGQWLGIIGPNGAGKSTLLRAIAGLTSYDGTVRLHGTDVRDLSTRARARQVAMVAQQPSIPLGTPVSDYVMLGRTPYLGLLQREGRADRQIVAEVLGQLDLHRFADRPLTAMSGGELQRIFLARALVQQPRILLLDEPTSALDIGHQQDVLDIIDVLRREHAVTVISTMHDLTMAGEYAERLVLLDGGAVIADDVPAQVLQQSLLESTYNARLAIIEAPGSAHSTRAVLPVRRPR